MKRTLLLLSFGALAAGCLHGGSPVPDTNQGEWARLRDRWTTQQKLYDRLDNRAFATATYQAPALRAARVRRLAEWRSMSEAETAAVLMQEQEDAKRYEDFLVTFFTPDRRANDLASQGSGWRIGLLVEGQGELLPLHVEEIPVDGTLETLYPTVGHFDTVYRIRFPHPRAPGLVGAPFTLRIAGAVGRLEFSWRPLPEDFVPGDATAGQ